MAGRDKISFKRRLSQDGQFIRSARPQSGPSEVLVRIKAAAVSPLDTKIRAGQAGHAQSNLPAVLGLDLAGVVEAVGSGVAAFRPGDVVYGMTGGVGDLPGSLAEYAAVDARLLAPRSAALTAREAAALPLVVITAWEGLVDRAGVRAGQRVLIHGGAGGIGQVAVQIAVARGAEVFATGSARSLATIRGLGATPIDYTTTPAVDYVAEHTGGDGFDVISTPSAARPSTRRSLPRATTPATWSARSAGVATASRRCPSGAPRTPECSPCCRC